MEQFRKGQLVPKRLNLISVGHKKARTQVQFGGDVTVDGRTIILRGEGPAINVVGDPTRRKRKNGTMQHVGPAVLRDVHLLHGSVGILK